MELTFIILLYWACNNFFFWNSFHVFTYSVHVLTYLLACLLVCLLACLLTYKKKNIWKSQVWNWFSSSNIAEIFTIQALLTAPSPKRKKCRIKFAVFIFSIFQIITSYLIDSSMVSYDAGMTAVNNVNRDVENLFVSISDHGIFLWNLSFRVYLLLYKNILGTRSCTFMRKFYLRGQRKISFFLYIFSFLLLPTPLKPRSA